nr:molybdenum cofactor biosynthesis protein MoaE [Rudaeicoccus suwonensis]
MTMTTLQDRVRLIDLRETPLSVDEVWQAVSDPAAGGVGLFVGQVRRTDHAKSVDLLEYSAHPTALEELRAVALEVITDECTAIAAVHRVGRLTVGDLAVVVAVSAPHRGEALRVCTAMIDTLKARVPIWKHQVFLDGSDEWVGM